MPRFAPRPREQRKRKVRDRLRQRQPAEVSSEPNTTAVLPSDVTAAREAKRQQLQADLRAQTPNVSGKKQKRLDKYIKNKLKKDENAEYLRLLEKEHAVLGKRRFEDFVQGQLHQNTNGIHKNSANEGLYNEEDDTASQDSYGRDADQEQELHEHADYASQRPTQTVTEAGTGLAAPLSLGADGLPLITQKKSHRKKRQKPEEPQEDEETWEGFSDGGNDGVELSREEKEQLLMSFLEEENSEVDSVDQTDDSKSDDSDESTNEPLDVSGKGGNLRDVSIERAKDLIMAFMNRPASDEDIEDSSSADDGPDSNDGLTTDGQQKHVEDSSNADDGSDSNAEDHDETDSTTSNTSTEEHPKITPRSSAFKTWATQQINQSLGHTPSYETTTADSISRVPPGTQKVEVSNPVLRALSPAPKTSRKAFSVHVERNESVQQARLELPIVQKEQEIMEAFHNNPVVIIKGDTGSGKTTQIPQMLFEAGYGSSKGPTPGMIGITQPRRVAAVSMSERVGYELGNHKEKVAYQVRFDSQVSSTTAIKFMTDGILLRELSQDLLLRKYSVIVIDEAHERSVNTDLLIGILSKVVFSRLRKNKFNPNPTPLKLVIMSATLNLEDFINNRLFSVDSKPPIVEAEGRQHRVTTHFARESRGDYLEEVIEKVRKGHHKLPRGGILVFLTGQNEIRQAADRLRSALAPRRAGPKDGEDVHYRTNTQGVPLEVEDMDFVISRAQDRDDFDDHEIITEVEDGEESDEFNISDDESNATEAGAEAPPTLAPRSRREPYDSVHILPLYSQLPTKQQLRVFEPPPENSRLIVLATNVAETSLTIPGIRYVFDTGRSKQRKYDLNTGVQSFEIDYISKANAAQRAGRAGRTGPGHCWRLYSSAMYEHFFPQHGEPEILRISAENIVLQLKTIDYPKPVVEFPFPSVPQPEALKKAEVLLKNLSALTSSGKITDIGKELSLYPVSPRLGKIISNGVTVPELLSNVLLLVAGLAVPEVFVQETQLDLAAKERTEDNMNNAEFKTGNEGASHKQQYGRARATLSRLDKTSDAIKLLTAASLYMSAADRPRLCREYYLRPKALSEVSQLYKQLKSIVEDNNPVLHGALRSIPNLSSQQVEQVNCMAASGYIDQVAIRADLAPHPPESMPRKAIAVPYLPLMPISRRISPMFLETYVFIHPSSVLARMLPKDLPPYIVYSHLQRAQSHSNIDIDVPKTRMFPLTTLSGPQLVQLSQFTTHLEYGKPIAKMKVVEIPGSPRRRECWVKTTLRSEGRGMDWPLNAVKVRQVLDINDPSGWRVEELLDILI